METTITELIYFLGHGNPDVRQVAAKNLASVASDERVASVFRHEPSLLKRVVWSTRDHLEVSAHDSYTTLVNLTAGNRAMSEMLLEQEASVMQSMMTHIADPKSGVADVASMLLSNITLSKEGAAAFLRADDKNINGGSGSGDVDEDIDDYVDEEKQLKLKEKEVSNANDIVSSRLNTIIRLLGYDDGYNPRAKLHYLATVINNVSRLPAGQRLLLDRKHIVLQRLLPMLSHESVLRRGGIAGALYNISFNIESHEWLVSDAVDVLPYMLLPLISNTEYSEEDMEGMPDSLQYMPEDKTRETDPEVRKLLVQALTQLAGSHTSREVMRGKKVYLIIRDLHRDEKDDVVNNACFRLIELLAGDDEGVKDYHEVEVPSNIEDLVKENGGGRSIFMAPQHADGSIGGLVRM